MVTAEVIMQRLETLEREYALAGMRKPQGRDAFEYGFVSGRCRGLSLAFEEVKRMVEDYERLEALKESEV